MMLDSSKFEKVWALTTSPVCGEAQAALHRAQMMVEAVGKTLDDVPEILSMMRGGNGRFTHSRPSWYGPKHVASYGPWADRQRRWNEGVLLYGQPDIMSAVDTGRLVRVHLKRWFPGVKFRIRTGDAFLVEWTGNPAQADVERLVALLTPGWVWLQRWTITRPSLDGKEYLEQVWADPTPQPHSFARLKWFDHFGITCVRHEDQVPVEVELAPPPPEPVKVATSPPPEPVSKAPWYSVQLPLNFG